MDCYSLVINMGKKQKTICKWGKEGIAEDFKFLSDIARKSKFICENCGRAANKKKWLCKPKPIQVKK